MPQSPDEIFDVVDEHDRVVGQASRLEVHSRGLLHRAVHIFVFDNRGRLLVQKRSATKDEFPGCLTSSASGHLDAGEDYDTAARRELQEELGLACVLTRLAKFPASPSLANEHVVLYSTVTGEPPRIEVTEIESVEYVAPAEIAERIGRHPEQFCPPFRKLLHWFLSEATVDSRLDALYKDGVSTGCSFAAGRAAGYGDGHEKTHSKDRHCP